MKIISKNILLKLCCVILISIALGFIIHFSLSVSKNSQITFNNFMYSYTSKDINQANTYLSNTSIPNINNVFDNILTQLDNETKSKIITELRNIMFDINYDILSSKTFFNSSTLKIRFTYFDLGKHIVNFFKNESSFLNNDVQNKYEKFLESLKSTKYKLSVILDVQLSKKNKQWNIIMSDKFLNILTSGIYKNF